MKKRYLAVGLGALAAGVAAIAAAIDRRQPQGGEGHAAPDLAPDAPPTDRAPVAFRPDMDAPMTPAEREALRPPGGPSPTLAAPGTSLPG